MKQQWFGAAAFAAMLALAGCVPLANTPAGVAPKGAGGAAASAQPGSPGAAAPPGAAGARNIVVGAAPGLSVELSVTPPAQVCDADAFADGVRYGYASTWNGEVGHPVAVSSAKKESGAHADAAPKPMFDPATVQSKDPQYVIHWGNGDEPANACATYGYEIGKIVGAHRAYVDLRAAGVS